MWIKFCNAFTKITAWPLQRLCFRTRIRYEDPQVQKRSIKGPAIIVCNHTSIYDYAVLLFVFFSRTLRCQMAELLFKKPVLGRYLRAMGGIHVDRGAHNFGFVAESEKILRHGGVVCIFPEARLPREGEARPLPFAPSAAFLALAADVPVIPVYTDGRYFSAAPATVVIGKPFYARELAPEGKSDRDTIDEVTQKMREIVIALGEKCHG